MFYMDGKYCDDETFRFQIEQTDDLQPCITFPSINPMIDCDQNK